MRERERECCWTCTGPGAWQLVELGSDALLFSTSTANASHYVTSWQLSLESLLLLFSTSVVTPHPGPLGRSLPEPKCQKKTNSQSQSHRRHSWNTVYVVAANLFFFSVFFHHPWWFHPAKLSCSEPSPHSSSLAPPLSHLVTSPGRVQAAFAASLISPVCCDLTHQLELSSFPSACLLHFYLHVHSVTGREAAFLFGEVANWIVNVKVDHDWGRSGHRPAGDFKASLKKKSRSWAAESNSLQVSVIKIMYIKKKTATVRQLFYKGGTLYRAVQKLQSLKFQRKYG